MKDKPVNERWELTAHNLRRLLTQAGVSQVGLAKRIKRDPTQINQMCQGRRGIGADMGRKLIDFFALHGIVIDHQDFFRPIDAIAAEGRLISVFDEGVPLNEVTTGRPTGREMTDSLDPKAFYYQAKENLVGDEVRAGDLLLVEPGRKIAGGDLVLVSLQEEVMVRRARDNEGTIYLDDPAGGESIPLESNVAPEYSWRIGEIKRKV